MSKLAVLLDADLDELKKSIEADNEEEQEDEDEEGYDEDEGLEKAFDSEEEGRENEDEDEEEAGDEDESEDDEEMEKSFDSNLTKSMSEDYGQAFEVSDFLRALTDEVGFSLEGMQKSMGLVTKQQNTLIKGLLGFGEVMQAAVTKIDAMEEENAELRKSLSELMERPVGRKGVVNQREVQTLQKSLGEEQQKKPLTREEVGDLLMKSFEAGDLNGDAIVRFDAGVPLERLGLPLEVKKTIGLA